MKNRSLSRLRGGSAALIALVLAVATGIAPLQAAMIGTDQVLRAEQERLTRAQVMAAFEDRAVMDRLVALGVDPDDARERVARLTDEEIVALNERMGEMPAGSDALGVVAAIFIILVITDAFGFTDVFTFVRSSR